QERLRARGKARSAPPPHPRFAVRLAGLKLQADVFVSAARADGGFVVALNRMNVTATHAMEGGVPALLLETRVVATVIVAPQSQKDGGDQQAINDGGGLQIHADERPAKPARSPPTSQTASRSDERAQKNAPEESGALRVGSRVDLDRIRPRRRERPRWSPERARRRRA